MPFGLFRKGKEVPVPPPELIEQLFLIGEAKNAMPLQLRGWINDVGLYVQLRLAGPAARLEAGPDIRTTSIDVWFRKDGGGWIPDGVRKYKPGDWERLVTPAAEVAEWILESGGMSPEMSSRLTAAIRKLKETGEWTLLSKPN